MNVEDAIRTRRSIRKFAPRELDQDTIEALLEAARLAPSASNLQTWRFRVVTHPEEKRELRSRAFNQRFVEEASAVIVCCADLLSFKDRLKTTWQLITVGKVRPSLEMALRMARGSRDAELTEERQIVNAAINVAIAVEHMVLRATELGLGTCWVRAFNASEVADYLALPAHTIPLVLRPVGYPAEDPAPRPRRDRDDILI